MRSAQLAVAAALLGVFSCCIASSAYVDSEWTNRGDDVFQAIRTFQDPDYLGGLDARGISLAEQLSRVLDQSLPGASKLCAEAGIFDGRIVVDGRSRDLIRNPLSAQPLPIQRWAEIRASHSPVQRAIATYALGLVGTKAHGLAKFLSDGERGLDGWEAQTLHRITCDNYASEGFRSLRPVPHFTFAPDDYQCSEPRRQWLYTNVLEGDRHWPAPFIEAAWSNVREHCDDSKSTAEPLPDFAQRALLKRIAVRKTDSSDLVEWLQLLANDVVATPVLIGPLVGLTRDSDESVAWAAQRALAASGTEAGAQQFAQWLDRHVFNWAWRELGPRIRAFPDIVIPALKVGLQSPNWDDRNAAATLLGELGTDKVIPILRDAVRSTDWQTAQAVANALAPFARENADADAILKDMQDGYWSGRVRAVARIARQTGKGIEGDPFDCDRTPEQVQAEEIANATGGGTPELSCKLFCFFCPPTHQLPTCPSQTRHARYLDDTGAKVTIDWGEPIRRELPRIKIADLSTWCNSVGTTVALEVDGGWLVGCSGFEGEGALGFVPGRGLADIKPIARFGVEAIVRIGTRIFAAGISPLEFSNAGALYEVLMDNSGSWTVSAAAALPSIPNAYAVSGNRLAFRDEFGAVLFDPAGSISPLRCR